MVKQLPIPPHRVRLPDPAGHFKKLDREDQDYMRELVAALQRELDTRIVANAAQDEWLLFSPSGSVYALTVTDAGVVGTVLRSQAP